VNRSPWLGGEILRDITRGGLAGLIVAFVVAGLGGRLVMRLAALLVPGATGALTENGNRIGDVTLAGSVGLILFVGLAGSIILATVWVSIAPWLPGRGVVPGLVAMPVAVALGAFVLVGAGNPDFIVLGHSPIVVILLLALIALTAPSMAVADGWLDRRLPHAWSIGSLAGIVYLALAVIGVAFGSLLVIQSIVGLKAQVLGITVLACGIVTIVWWAQRLGGAPEPSRLLRIAGRMILVIGTAAGYVALAPDLEVVLLLG